MSIGAVVAKKKARSTKAKEPPADRVDFIRIRVSGTYKEWVQRFAESMRSDMSDLIDDALVSFAREKGFDPPPKR